MKRLILPFIFLFAWQLVCNDTCRRVRVPLSVTITAESEIDSIDEQIYEDIKQELLEKRQIFLYDKITDFVAEEVISAIEYLNEQSTELPITIYINSQGGDIVSGFSIIDAMMHSKAKVKVIVTGKAWSMAGFIVLAADEAYMRPHSTLMLHPVQVEISGSFPIVSQRIALLDRLQRDVENLVRVSGNFTEQEIRQIFTTELWLTAEECLEKGIITGILDTVRGEDCEVRFDSTKHRYYINGKYVPAVSTILNLLNKPGLIPWALKLVIGYLERHNITPTVADYYKYYKLALAERDRAGEKGAVVHHKVEEFLAGKSVEYTADEQINHALDAFFRWYDEHVIELIDRECIVYSPLYRYAGTFDIVANIDGSIYLVDFKTSKDIYPDYVMQVAAYKSAIEELGGYFRETEEGWEFVRLEKPIEKAAILRLDKATGYPVFKVFTDEELTEAFSKFVLMSRYYWLNRRSK